MNDDDDDKPIPSRLAVDLKLRLARKRAEAEAKALRLRGRPGLLEGASRLVGSLLMPYDADTLRERLLAGDPVAEGQLGAMLAELAMKLRVGEAVSLATTIERKPVEAIELELTNPLDVPAVPEVTIDGNGLIVDVKWRPVQ